MGGILWEWDLRKLLGGESGMLNFSNAFMYGSVTVGNGGLLNASNPEHEPVGETCFYGNIYVERGGELNAGGDYNYSMGIYDWERWPVQWHRLDVWVGGSSERWRA